MRSSARFGRLHATPAHRAALSALAALALACASSPDAPPELPWPAPPPAGSVRVQVVFGAEADLDLYVTDSALETVYFANTPAKLGGALEADLRCDAPPPRVETVLLPAAPPGRYRVGVDFPERCERGVEQAHFAVRVEGAGLRLSEQSVVPFGRFHSRVLEFDVTERAAP